MKSRRRVKVKTSQPKVASTQVYLYLLRTNQCRIRTSGYINFRRSQGKEKGSGPDHWQNRARNIAKLFGNNIRWLVVGGWQLSTAQLSSAIPSYTSLTSFLLHRGCYLVGTLTHGQTIFIMVSEGSIRVIHGIGIGWKSNWRRGPSYFKIIKIAAAMPHFGGAEHVLCSVYLPTYIGVAGVRMAINNAKVMMLLTCSYLLKCIAVGHVFNGGGVVWLWL